MIEVKEAVADVLNDFARAIKEYEASGIAVVDRCDFASRVLACVTVSEAELAALRTVSHAAKAWADWSKSDAPVSDAAACPDQEADLIIALEVALDDLQGIQQEAAEVTRFQTPPAGGA